MLHYALVERPGPRGRQDVMAQQRSRRKSSGGISRKSRSPVDHHEVEWHRRWGARARGSLAPASLFGGRPRGQARARGEDRRRLLRLAGLALLPGGVRPARPQGRDRHRGDDGSLSPAEGNVRRRREITEPRKDDKSAAPGKASGPVGERAPDGEPAGGPSDPGVTGTRWYQPEGQRPGPRRGSARRRVASRQGP